MRTEITLTPHSMLRHRIDYITDADGGHKAMGLEVHTFCLGVGDASELPHMVRTLVSGSFGRRGRKRKHVAWELTLHPADATGAKCAFRSRAEMEKVAREVLNEFGARYALVGLHGLQDIHILILNWGATGLGLKSYLPNRSNPRRVLVAVADRIEEEINEERRKSGDAELVTIKGVRERKRTDAKRLHLHDQIARQLSGETEPTVTELLMAISRCGWSGVVKGKKMCISFSPSRPPLHYELDLWVRGALRAWRRRYRELESEIEPENHAPRGRGMETL